MLFIVTEMLVVPVAGRCPGTITAIDTHWIWQEGNERLTNCLRSHLILITGA